MEEVEESEESEEEADEDVDMEDGDDESESVAAADADGVEFADGLASTASTAVGPDIGVSTPDHIDLRKR